MTLWENIHPWEGVNQQPKCRVLERDWKKARKKTTKKTGKNFEGVGR